MYDEDPIADYNKIDYFLRPYYNRVEGVTPDVGLIFNKFPGWPFITIIEGAYGTKHQNWQYDLVLQRLFNFSGRKLLFRYEHFQLTDANETWKIPKYENSIGGIFLHEDFYNLFTKYGWRYSVDQKVFSKHLFRIEYARYYYQSMEVNSNFASSLAGDFKHYRSNPPIPEIVENNFKFIFLLDNRDNVFFPSKGALLKGIMEITGGDKSTTGLFLDLSVYFPVFNRQKFVVNTMFATRVGSTAPQHLISIGGIGTLRAFPDFYKSGQNFYYSSINYHFGGTIIQSTPLKRIPGSDTVSLVVFAEAGDAWNHAMEKENLFDSINKAGLFYDAGISLLLMDGIFRIDYAVRPFIAPHYNRLTIRLFHKF